MRWGSDHKSANQILRVAFLEVQVKSGDEKAIQCEMLRLPFTAVMNFICRLKVEAQKKKRVN